jgi:shikimate kinase
MPLADTDRMIADREEKSINAIFREDGEEHFRCAETELLRLIAARGGLIVATGGGMPMRRINADIMKNSGFTVFLDRKLAALHGQDTKGRPLIAAPTQEEVDANIDRLYHERRETYLAAADVTLDPDEPGAAERIAELFMRRLNDPA